MRVHLLRVTDGRFARCVVGLQAERSLPGKIAMSVASRSVRPGGGASERPGHMPTENVVQRLPIHEY